MNFVFFSLQRINTDRESTSTGLAKELAKTHKVLYVNPPINRKTYALEPTDPFVAAHIQQIRNRQSGLVKLSENLYSLNLSCVLESINWIPFTTIFQLVNRVNNLQIAREVEKYLHELDMEDFIFISDKAMFNSYYLKEMLEPKLFLYLHRDNTVVMDYWRRHGTKVEPQLMEKADAILCNSLDFQRMAKIYNPHSFYIGNGVDLKLFTNEVAADMPGELKGLQRPVVGYVGALITMRLNLNLIFQTAKDNPRMSFVLIGPEDEDFQQSELHNLENVYFFGKIHKDQIPAYLSNFDVCINPQKRNAITLGNFPLKIVEYLAMGKPVVAVETNTMKETFGEVCYIAKDQNAFSQLLHKAIAEDSAEKRQTRIAFSRQFGWEKVAENVLSAIKEISKGN